MWRALLRVSLAQPLPMENCVLDSPHEWGFGGGYGWGPARYDGFYHIEWYEKSSETRNFIFIIMNIRMSRDKKK